MELIEKLISMGEGDALNDAFELTRELEEKGSFIGTDFSGREKRHYDEGNFTKAHEYSREIRSASAKLIRATGDEDMLLLNKRTLLFDAPHNFDCAFRYAEWNRPIQKRFYEPRRKQLKRAADAMQRLEERKIHRLLLMCPPGIGKALANDTPVLTRNGWKKHGDLVVGDEVIGVDGKFKKVIAVHPKCEVDRLVEFSNGEKIICHENHEWNVYDRGRRHYRVHDTKYIEGRSLSYGGEEGHRGHRYAIQLPHTPVIEGEHKDLFDPYTLGVWLGDGTNRNPTVCCAPNDKAVIDRIVRNGHSIEWHTTHKSTGVLYFGFRIRKELRQYGMCHSKHRTEKHIPEDYLTASVEQRLELLAGLIDTDGTLAGKKYCFTTADTLLRDTFVELIATFGWRACVREYAPTTSSSGVKARRPYYTISFTPNLHIPCELERKRNNEPRPQRAIAFKKITKVSPVEGNCITVEGDGMYLVGKTLVPTHNSTLAIGFMVWSGMRNYDLSILGVSHNNAFLRGVYDEMLRFLDQGGEYLWSEIFPDVFISNTLAKDMRIDLVTQKRFQTFELSSVGSGNAGKVRATNLLYCDDLVDGLESAMSIDRMDKLWGLYNTDARQRMLGDCAELIIQTPWSLHDPIDRLESMFENDPDTEIIKFPALDENDESNFDYPYGLGYTTKQFHDQREIMDDVSWRALYMCQPIEREGQLYDPESLKRYYELPDKEPDVIFAVADTKEQGPDYCAMPIVYKYGDEYYIDKFICDNGNPDIIEERIAQTLVERGVKLARFESNRGGTLFATDVQKKVKAKGGITKITTKWNQTNKDTRIITRAGWVKEHCVFRDESVYDKEYRTAMDMLCQYNMAGKNKHDDVPDVMADLADYVENMGVASVSVAKRFF